jgi:hypothetical protein
MSGNTSRHAPSLAGEATHAAGAWTGTIPGMWPPHSAGHPPKSQATAPLPPLHQVESLAHGWPLRDFIELGALDSSVPCARHRTRCILWEWRLTQLSDNVELLVAELVTNAVSASRCLDWPYPVRIWLLSDRVSVLIVVWDASPQPPVHIDPIDDAESGRGLLLVDAIATRWDWCIVPDMGGKIVHALITE